MARETRILQVFAETLAACGVAGETCAAELIYLALTSRLLEQPVSAALKGPSSGGKSFLLEWVLSFFPRSAYYTLTGMSPHALVYSHEPLEHRMLVIFEAAGLHGDLPNYFVRSLLSEGRVCYDTVVKTRLGLEPRRIERAGPTGLLLTTTAIRLHPEIETRLLSISVTDTPEQTAAILAAAAEERLERPDLRPWRAFQMWLADAEHRVVIPYALNLAKAIPPVAVRLRRDFPTVLSLITSHAILHQHSRDKDEQGRIIATAADYRIVRSLVADVLAEGVEVAVPSTVRETVAAVEALITGGNEEVSVKQVAMALKLDESAALRRVQSAIEQGFLKNLEEGRGRQARIVLGDPIPDPRSLLPRWSEIEGLQGCT